MSNRPLRLTGLADVEFFKREKARDIYDFGEQLLIVSTDRNFALM
jgi:hypothetical protein